MKNSILLLILSISTYSNIYCQQIKWNNVKYREIDPKQLSSSGYINIDKGGSTDKSDISINFSAKKIFYRSPSGKSFSLNEDEFNGISIDGFKGGQYIDGDYLFSDAGREVAATLRKELYKKADLNIIEITSVEKEGFFNRKKPKFYINNGELDVSNKVSVKSKLLSINEDYITFIDSDGDILNQSDYSLSRDTSINQNDGDIDKDDREKRKKIRKTAGILNIKFNGKVFLNSYELYNYLFESYEKKFFDEIEIFKNNFVGKNVIDIMEDWGPSSTIEEMDNSKKLYTWIFEKKSTTGEETSVSQEFKAIKEFFGSQTSGSGSSNTYYSGRSSSRTTYDNILDSYDTQSSYRGSSNSFLQFHSSTTGYRYKTAYGKKTTNSQFESTEIDVSEKIALVVDSNMKVINVLNKGFIEYPKYGMNLNFIVR